MNRPKVERPRLQQWHDDDTTIKELVERLKEKVLDIGTWEFVVEGESDPINYYDIIDKLKENAFSLTKSDLKTIREIFMDFPREFAHIKKDVTVAFRGFIVSLDERLTLMESLNDYIDYLEDENAQLKEQVEQTKVKDLVEQESQSLRSEINTLRDAFIGLQQRLDIDEDEVEEIKEVKPKKKEKENVIQNDWDN